MIFIKSSKSLKMGNVGYIDERSGIMHRTMFVTGGAGIPCGSSERSGEACAAVKSRARQREMVEGTVPAGKKNRKKKKNIKNRAV